MHGDGLRSVSSVPLISLAGVAVDVETTGLDPIRDRIVQFGAVRLRGGVIDDEKPFDRLVDPGVSIPPATTAIHGLTDSDVAGAARFRDLVPEIERFLARSVVIGHSIGFDLAILKAEYDRAGLNWQRPRSLDTAVLARIVNPLLPEFSLEAISQWLGVEITDRHTALGDALAAARVFAALVPLLRGGGVLTLGQAERASRGFGENTAREVENGWVPAVIGADEARARHAALARVDSFPFRHRVADVMSAPPVIVAPETSLSETAGVLVERNCSSVFVRGENTNGAGRFGIVTERDLMRSVLKPGEISDRTAGDIMSRPLRTVGARDFVYQAIGQMKREGIRHLGVIDEQGDLVGALATGDMLRQRARDALVLGFEIEEARTTADLAAGWARLPLVARKLLDEEVGAREVAAIIAEELCAATRKAGELALGAMIEADRGEPPAPFALLVLGSAARGETLLSPDQDNAIIYEDGTEADDAGIDKWFEDFAVRLATILNEVGIPFCPGGVMAKTRQWRQSLAEWKKTVDGWIAHAKAKDLLAVDIFFDFRPVFGTRDLANDLWRHAYARAHDAPGFLRELAAISTGLRAPIGFLGNIQTVDGRIDVKAYGLRAIASGGRVLSLRHGIETAATEDRLAGVRDRGLANRQDIDNVIEAQEILLLRDLEQQIIDIEIGLEHSNRVDVKRLTKREYRQLKWALGQVEVMDTLIGDPVAFG